MENQVIAILNRVLEQQRFAESKHGALIAVSIAAAFGIFGFYSQGADGLSHQELAAATAALFFASAFISLVSFAPRLSRHVKRQKREHKTANLLHFADLVGLDETMLKSALTARAPNSIDSIEILDDYVNQIIVNAAITTRKYWLFNIAALLFVLSVGAATGLFWLEVT